VCVKATDNPKQHGFYVITLKDRSKQDDRLKGGIVRKVAVDKTRSSLEKVLASTKQKLEAQPISF